ncbi:Auxin-responsive protein [Actinidia chinensis var. chinensis]|uniref:Auxin-responsive protein n=1 Tax=Actinidia chinensis var. chinensis TaxID=1590841 RepID=A0A2R6R019_ACTCC|nr:Auxin-responsive protein [Actinidia chinensis var. chinensis]
MISHKKLIKMARKLQKFATTRTKRISFPRNNRDANVGSCTTSLVADKGHYVVYTAGQRRFMIPLVYLNNEIVRELFKLSKEFGLPSDGPITLPCDSVFMEYVILLIQRGVAINLEKALLATVSSLSSFYRAYANQELLVYRFNHTVAF